MRIIAKILQSVLINHFYKLNAGFFIFLFFLLFGVVRGGQLIEFHLGLIQAILGGPLFLLIIIILWGLYTLKCINYITKRLMEPGLSFLTCMNRLPRKQVWGWMCFVHFEVYFPVISYVIIIIAVAIKAHQYQQALIIFTANLVFYIAAVRIYFKCLQLHSIEFILLRFRFPTIQIVKPYFLFPLFFIWQERKWMLLLTKLFTLIYLYGFIQFYEPYRYDIRPMLLSIILVIAAHTTIIFQIRSFETEFLLFSRNLPISIWKRFFQIIGFYFVLLLPELLFVWKGYPLHFNVLDYSQIVFMVISLPAFFHAILYTSIMNGDEYMKIVFAILTALFFLILYDLGILLFVFVVLLALIFFYFHYYEFEKSNLVNSPKN
ncbi:MAG: hypothetical protein WCJ80_00950 [Bacteroidota bacterium]